MKLFGERVKKAFSKVSDGFWERIGAAVAVLFGAVFIWLIFEVPKIAVNSIPDLFKRLSEQDTTLIVNSNPNYKAAKEFEDQGFEALINKKYNAAIICFTNSENSYNGYRSSYEIRRYLLQRKDLKKGTDFWVETYQYLIRNHEYCIPKEVCAKMKQYVKDNGGQ